MLAFFRCRTMDVFDLRECECFLMEISSHKCDFGAWLLSALNVKSISL